VVCSIREVISVEDFVNIEMTAKDRQANVAMDDDNDKVIYEQTIEWTDCPEGVWKFYLEGNVLLVPSEH
jgi:hypothetical protein